MKVGVIGCGRIAGAHLEAVRGIPGLDVVAVCDSEDARARRVADRFHVPRAYRHATDLLDSERPDVVHVVTPPQSHRDLSIEAMEMGCHVFVEKPMAVDARDAAEMLEASRNRGRTLGVCHNFLFDPAMLDARARASSGDLGRVLGAEVYWKVRMGHARYGGAKWKRQLPGGVVHDVVCHPVYLLREFLGELAVVTSVSKEIDGAAPPATEFRALFESEQGLGSASVSFCSNPWQRVIRIYGSETTVHVDLAGHSRPRGGTHANVIERFYEALVEGRPPPVTGEDGRAVVGVLDRLWATPQPAAADNQIAAPSRA